MIDLLVVGGGPVGLVTALEASQQGLSVVVVDRRAGDGDKACGEGLMPSAVAALAVLGVDPPGRDIRGIRYLGGGRLAAAQFTGPPGRGVRRTTLVRVLRERLDAAGVPRLQGNVTALDQRRDSVAAAGVQARYVAVADGLHSPLRRSLGLAATTTKPARYGIRRHARVRPWTSHVEVYWSESGEAYVTPVSDSLVGVAVLGSGGTAFDRRLAEFPALEARLRGADWGTRARGAGPLRQRSTQRVQGRALLVGDAAGYVDALTGEGMAVGFASARELVRCVAADTPQDYEAAWRRATRRPRLITEAVLRSTRPAPVRRMVVPAAATLPRAFAGIVNQLA